VEDANPYCVVADHPAKAGRELGPSAASVPPPHVLRAVFGPAGGPAGGTAGVGGGGADPLPMLLPAHAPTAAPSTRVVVVYPLFFHVPKAAGTSVEVELEARLGKIALPAGDLADLACGWWLESSLV